MSGGMGGNRLAVLADEAKGALGPIVQGEEFTIGGWLAYGRALNEGRALFPDDDKAFGQWMQDNLLCQLDTVDGPKEVDRHDRAATMWADANPAELEEARQRGNPRTIRGMHAKWKEIEAERAEEQRRQEAEAQKVSAPDTVVCTDEQSYQPEDQPVSVEQDVQPEAEPEPDPYADQRKGLGGYTRQGIEDALIEKCIAFEEERTRRKKAEANERKANKLLRDMTTNDDQEVIRRLNKQLANVDNAKWRAEEELSSWKRRVHAQKNEITTLKIRVNDAGARARARKSGAVAEMITTRRHPGRGAGASTHRSRPARPDKSPAALASDR